MQTLARVKVMFFKKGQILPFNPTEDTDWYWEPQLPNAMDRKAIHAEHINHPVFNSFIFSSANALPEVFELLEDAIAIEFELIDQFVDDQKSIAAWEEEVAGTDQVMFGCDRSELKPYIREAMEVWNMRKAFLQDRKVAVEEPQVVQYLCVMDGDCDDEGGCTSFPLGRLDMSYLPIVKDGKI